MLLRNPQDRTSGRPVEGDIPHLHYLYSNEHSSKQEELKSYIVIQIELDRYHKNIEGLGL